MTTKFLLTEDELPSHWYNILADVPEPLGAFLSPRTLEPLTPPDLTPIFPMAIIGQEVSTERWIEIPDRVRDIYKMWRPTPLYRAKRLEKALDTPARIFYKYEGTSPAGSHKPNTAVRAGVLQRRGRHQAADHRDRRRPVGLGARLRRRPVRPRGHGLHGQGLLPAEAVPARAHGDVGRQGPPLPDRPDRVRPQRARQGARVAGQPRHRHLRGRRGRRHARRQPLLARLGGQPRPPPPDRDRPGGAEADGDGRRVSRRRDRLRRRWLELRRPRVSVPRRPPRRQDQHPLHRRRAGRVPDPHPRSLRLRLRRHRGHGPGRADVHARPQLHSRHAFMPADCATTATRRRCACSSRTASSKRAHTSRTSASRRRCASRAARESCPRPSRRTRSVPWPRRPRPHARPAIRA